MTHYTRSRVVSVRLSEDVYEALKEHAKDDGRSASGSITYLVTEEVKNRLSPRKANRKLTGFLSHFEVPRSLAEWQAARRGASRKLVPRPQRSRRNRTSR
jgi:hypothetical protein